MASNGAPLGATHYGWTRDVRREVEQALAAFPQLSANTYKNHPWPGWDDVSVDYWSWQGRGYPAPMDVLENCRDYVLSHVSHRAVRHWILGHTLWTSFGGFSYWAPADHSGRLRHLHVTYWK
jgi:hypothetical protein